MLINSLDQTSIFLQIWHMIWILFPYMCFLRFILCQVFSVDDWVLKRNVVMEEYGPKIGNYRNYPLGVNNACFQ
jgi:hypothetical protein